MEKGGDGTGREGRERREESVPIVPVLRNDHWCGRQGRAIAANQASTQPGSEWPHGMLAHSRSVTVKWSRLCQGEKSTYVVCKSTGGLVV